MSDEAINVSYTNWRGEISVRRVLLGDVRFGVTEWHKEPTWLINAFDLDHPAQIWKEFDLTKCDFNRNYMPGEVDRLRAALSGMLEHVSNQEFCYCEYKDHTEPADEGEAVDAACMLVNNPKPKEQEDDKT